jgi:hypothetical protein
MQYVATPTSEMSSDPNLSDEEQGWDAPKTKVFSKKKKKMMRHFKPKKSPPPMGDVTSESPVPPLSFSQNSLIPINSAGMPSRNTQKANISPQNGPLSSRSYSPLTVEGGSRIPVRSNTISLLGVPTPVISPHPVRQFRSPPPSVNSGVFHPEVSQINTSDKLSKPTSSSLLFSNRPSSSLGRVMNMKDKEREREKGKDRCGSGLDFEKRIEAERGRSSVELGVREGKEKKRLFSRKERRSPSPS